MTDCRVCDAPHDDAVHASGLRLRRWPRDSTGDRADAAADGSAKEEKLPCGFGLHQGSALSGGAVKRRASDWEVPQIEADVDATISIPSVVATCAGWHRRRAMREICVRSR